MSLSDLIARLEKATGPSLALDIEIRRAFLPSEMYGSKVESWFNDGPVFGCNTADGMRHLDCLRAPACTASTDAAMTLFGDDYAVSLDWWPRIAEGYRENNPRAHVEATRIDHDGFGTKDRFRASADTMALALCSAYLKALEAQP